MFIGIDVPIVVIQTSMLAGDHFHTLILDLRCDQPIIFQDSDYDLVYLHGLVRCGNGSVVVKDHDDRYYLMADDCSIDETIDKSLLAEAEELLKDVPKADWSW